jgi:hypothetical protein
MFVFPDPHTHDVVSSVLSWVPQVGNRVAASQMEGLESGGGIIGVTTPGFLVRCQR